jgi:hypothetical protein
MYVLLLILKIEPVSKTADIGDGEGFVSNQGVSRVV